MVEAPSDTRGNCRWRVVTLESELERIAALAARQHGVITRRQLLAAGLTSRMVEGRVRRGRLRPLHRGVYLMGALQRVLEPPLARAMAAVLASGPGALLSHRHAAWLWDLLPESPRAAAVEVTIPAHARRRRPGVRLHRSLRSRVRRSLDPSRDPAHVRAAYAARSLQRASPPRPRAGLRAGPAHRVDRRAAPHQARRRTRRPSGCACPPGRAPRSRGTRPDPVGGRGTSPGARPEGAVASPRSNALVHGFELDFWWPGEQLAVEVDGFAFHRSRRRFERDRLRDAELAAAGVRVVRVTWRQIVEDGDATLVRIAQALARAPTQGR